MTTDIATKLIAGNPVKAGNVVAGAQKTGTYSVEVNAGPPAKTDSPAAWQAALDTRLDPGSHGATIVSTR